MELIAHNLQPIAALQHLNIIQIQQFIIIIFIFLKGMLKLYKLMLFLLLSSLML